MIINVKTAKMLSITLMRRPLLGRAGIVQLTNHDYPDVGYWQTWLQKSVATSLEA